MARVCLGGSKIHDFDDQLMLGYGDLANIYIQGHPPLHISVVDSYNRLTNEINTATWHETREFLLDQRHRFYVQAMLNQRSDFAVKTPS